MVIQHEPRVTSTDTDTSKFSKADQVCLTLAKHGQSMTTQEIADSVGYASSSSVRKVIQRRKCISRNAQGAVTHNNLLCDTVSHNIQMVMQSDTVSDIRTYFDARKEFEISGEHLRDINSVLSDGGIHFYPSVPPDISHDCIYEDLNLCNYRIQISSGRINVWMMKKDKSEGYGLNLKHYKVWRDSVSSKIDSVCGFAPALTTVRVDLQQDDFSQEYTDGYASKVISELFKLQIYSSFRPEVNKYIKHTEVMLRNSAAVKNIDIVQEVLSNSAQKILNMESQEKLNYLMLQELREYNSQRIGFMRDLTEQLNDFAIDQTHITGSLVRESNTMKNALVQKLQQLNLHTAQTNIQLQNIAANHFDDSKYSSEELLIGIHRALDRLSQPSLLRRIWRRFFA